MIISHQHRFIFFHNPKTAGMSLRAMLAPFHDDKIPMEGILQPPACEYPMDVAHLRLWEISALLPAVITAAQTYRSLIFVREPSRRFVSALDQVFKTYYPDLPMATLGPLQQMLIVETFVETMLRVETVRTNHRFVHFSPQVWFLQDSGARLHTRILPMDDHGAFISRGLEYLGLPPIAIPHENRSRVDLTHVLKSPKIAAFVRGFYAEDLAFFAADPELARLAEPVTDGTTTGEMLYRRYPRVENTAQCDHSQPGRSNCDTAPVHDAGLRTDAVDEASGLSANSASSSNSALSNIGAAKSIDTASLDPIAMQIDAAAVDLVAGRLQDAFVRVRTILDQNPDHPRALGMLGQITVVMERPGLGLLHLQRAVVLDPRLEHRIWLALCLAKLGCPEDAVRQINAAIPTMPPTANAHFSVGMVLYALGEHAAAAEFYASCIALDATRAAAHHRYGRALQASGRIGSAVDAYNQAVRHCGERADYYADLSGALSDVGRFEEACAAGKTAVELDPGCIAGYNNLGHALHSLSRSDEALGYYERALELHGRYPKVNVGYALALLKSGDFARGWQHYEWRWQDCQTVRADLDALVWRGQCLRGESLRGPCDGGHTILLHAEQGFGDTLQFVRFAPLVASRGGRVVLEVPAPLVRLLRTVAGVAEVICRGDPLPRFDFHCPMASLPLAFGLRIDNIPASAYLPPPEAGFLRQGVALRDRLAISDGPPALLVGLVWAGDPRRHQPGCNLVDGRRSTSLDAFAPLTEIDGVRLVSFQLGEAREQLSGLESPIPGTIPILDAMEGVTDFADTAARLAGVDLLISVDTAMAHLAGGLGMPVWMLSRFDGCWRWLERRTDTPWYPSMRIFRQPSPGDWSSVITDVAAALRELICRRRAEA